MSTWGNEPSQQPPSEQPWAANPTPPPPPPPSAYPQPGPSPYAQPGGYPQPPAGYPAPQYAGAPVPHPQPPVKKSPLMGQIALALVVVTAVTATVAMGPIATVMGQLIVATGSTDLDSDTLAAAVAGSAAGWSAVFQLATMVGTLASFIGLAAAITKRGRAAGVTAFVLGLLTPLIYIVYAVIVIWPAIVSIS